MDEFKDTRHPLEGYPHQPLSNGITRRQLFSTLVTELKLQLGKKKGAVGIKLPEIGVMTDEQLKDLIPKIIPQTKILIREGAVWALCKGEREQTFLFAIDPISNYVFNLINGENSILVISHFLAAHSLIPYERAFSITRGMFLTLIKNRVCLPVNNPFVG